MVAYSDFKIVEASLEAIPQIYFLIVFSLASWLLPKKSYLGLISAAQITFGEAAFLLLSLAHSYASSMTSIISAMDIRKHDQLTFTSKLLLGLSATFQLAGRLWQMVVISMLAIVDNCPLSASQAGLLLILPVVCHWVSIIVFLYCKVLYTSQPKRIHHGATSICDVFSFNASILPDLSPPPVQQVEREKQVELLEFDLPRTDSAPDKQHLGK